jgi:hypothetical protein
MNTDSSELTYDDIYQRKGWGESMDRQSMTVNAFTPGWWSNLMQTVMALGLMAILGLLLSMKSDVNALMRDFPYVSKSDYKEDKRFIDSRLNELERRK